MQHEKNMSQKELFLFWLPLAAMWILMAIEQPLVSAGMARMPDAAENLAAFGICFSLALIIEGPIIQMLSAATALCGNRENFRSLLKFMHFLGAGLTMIHLLVAIPVIFRFICGTLMGVPDNLITLSHRAFLIMTPWTLAIGYRRLLQGVLIKYRKTIAIPLSMAIRITASIIMVILGVRSTVLKGAEMGALTMAIAVNVGAIATWLLVRPELKSLPNAADENMPYGGDRDVKSFREIVWFYIPLGLTSLITLVARPILTAGIARGPFPVESLAVWPVITGFLFLFQSSLLSNQEAVIALLNKGVDHSGMRRFTITISIIIGGLFFLIALSPLAEWWYTNPAGLDATLLSYALMPNLAIGLVPLISGFLAWHRGVQISRGKTGTVARAVVINILVLTGSITIFSLLLNFAYMKEILWVTNLPLIFSGATAGALSFTAAVLFEMLYLRKRTLSGLSQLSSSFSSDHGGNGKTWPSP
jgi:hypothetical protein